MNNMKTNELNEKLFLATSHLLELARLQASDSPDDEVLDALDDDLRGLPRDETRLLEEFSEFLRRPSQTGEKT